MLFRSADALAELVGDVQDAVDDQGLTFLASDVDADGGKLILTDGVPRVLGDDLPMAVEDADALEAWLGARAARRVRLLVPQRGDKRALIELATRNAELSYRTRFNEITAAHFEALETLRGELEIALELEHRILSERMVRSEKRSELQSTPGHLAIVRPKRRTTASLSDAFGDVAQLVERLLCKQEVVGSIPIVSTIGPVVGQRRTPRSHEHFCPAHLLP